MKKEKSCGCIIINKDKVLLVYERMHNFWGFPKGHVEKNETEVETALREVKEEVGLEVEIDKDKRHEQNYYISDKDIYKTIVLFLAKPKNTDVKMQVEEIEDFKWCSFEEALDTITYDDTKELFKNAISNIGEFYGN